MTFRQFLLILRAHWIIATLTFLLCVGAAAGATWLMPSEYTASTAVLVDVKSPDPVAGMYVPALGSPAYMATQVDIVTSERVALMVVKSLKLDESPAVVAKWQADSEGRGDAAHWLAGRLLKRVDVKPSKESNVLNIAYTATDAPFAAAVANAFAQAYIESSIALSVGPARQYNDWFRHRSDELRDNLEAAQRRLTEYQQSHGILASDERLDAENQKLNELQSQYVQALGQNADSSSKRNSAGGESLPEVMQSGVVQQLKSDIARNEAKLQDLGGNLGRNHPMYQRSEAELAMLKRKLAEETTRVSTSIDTAGRISQGKEAEIRVQMDAVKRRILDLKKAHGDIDMLKQAVDSAQKLYESVEQRANQVNLSSQNTQTNVSVLSPASEPMQRSSPRLVINLLVGVLAGLLLGIGAALGRELSHRRVRSGDDLEQHAGLIFLAELAA